MEVREPIYIKHQIYTNMIKTFKCKETEQIYNQQFSKKLPSAIQKTALRKLIMMENAANIQDLKVPPSNHLEKLSGDRTGQYGIRINDNIGFVLVWIIMIYIMWK